MPTATKTKKSRRKPKAKKGTIHIGVLIDESGSMGGKEPEVVEGINQFVDGLRGQENSERTKLTLSFFDTKPGAYPAMLARRVPADRVPLDDFPLLSMGDYNPRGGTPLRDAVADTIGQMGSDMKKGDKALLVIYTDGGENQSREISPVDLQRLTAAKEREGWTFIYLGANQDAWAEGGAMGMAHAGATFNYTDTSAGRRSAFRSMRHAGASYLSEDASLGVFASANATTDSIGEDEALTTDGTGGK